MPRRRDRLHRLIVAEVEHEQRFRVRRRGAVPAARGQLEVRTGARHREEHAVVAVVIAEAADLGQPEAVSVERDDLIQALGMPGDAQPHRRQCGETRSCYAATRSSRRNRSRIRVPPSSGRSTFIADVAAPMIDSPSPAPGLSGWGRMPQP